METREIVDQTTGEIIEVDVLAAEAVDVLTSVANRSLPFLWKIGRAIRSNTLAADTSDQRNSVAIIQIEIDRLETVKSRMLEKLQENVFQLTGIAEAVMAEANVDKIKLDGVGTFRYRKLPDKVTDGAIPFESLTESQKADSHGLHPDLIKKKVTYQPDKKAIKAVLEAGESIAYFAIEHGGQKFEFAEEKCN